MPWNPLVAAKTEHSIEPPHWAVVPHVPWTEMAPGDSVCIDLYDNEGRQIFTDDQVSSLVKAHSCFNVQSQIRRRFYYTLVDDGYRARIWRIDQHIDIPIDKGVPLPLAAQSKHWPWNTMEVGQSFWVPLPDQFKRIQHIAAERTYNLPEDAGYRWVCRKMYKDKVMGVRVFKVATHSVGPEHVAIPRDSKSSRINWKEIKPGGHLDMACGSGSDGESEYRRIEHLVKIRQHHGYREGWSCDKLAHEDGSITARIHRPGE